MPGYGSIKSAGGGDADGLSGGTKPAWRSQGNADVTADVSRDVSGDVTALSQHWEEPQRRDTHPHTHARNTCTQFCSFHIDRQRPSKHQYQFENKQEKTTTTTTATTTTAAAAAAATDWG